jgi:transcriptional regulator with XRE-family HTH domain
MPNPADQITPLLEGLRGCGLSEVQIAQRSGVARSAIWKIEKGITRSPSLDSYVKIAGCY